MIRNIFNRVLHRIAQAIPGGFSIRPMLHRIRGAKIGRNVWISHSVYLDELHPEAVTIGDNSSIGMRTSIITHFYWGPRVEGQYGEVVIGKDVFIGPHCLILPNVHIGDGAVIRGGTVVTRNIPPHTFWSPPGAEAVAAVTVPLTPEHNYKEFVKGLRPIRQKKK